MHRSRGTHAVNFEDGGSLGERRGTGSMSHVPAARSSPPPQSSIEDLLSNSGTTRGDDTGRFATYNLLVQVDNDDLPVKVTCTVDSLDALLSHLQHVIERPIARVGVWDAEWEQYVPLTSIGLLRGKARLKVESGGVRLLPVRQDTDALEWNALMDHVERMGPPREGCIYQLMEAQRIVNPALERAFQDRKVRLLDPRARTAMLFYTNNACPSEHALEHGFSVLPGSANQGIVFANDIDIRPGDVNTYLKFLLCEVAVGRSFSVHSVDRATAQLRGFDRAHYDSLLNLTTRPDTGTRLDEWVVFHPDQAIPRYVVTCCIVRGTARNAWNYAALGCSRHPGEALKVWCVPCRTLICPYCMTVGAHKGHDGKEAAEVATFEKTVLGKMAQTLDNTIAKRQEEVAELERTKMVLHTISRKGEDNIRRVMTELHQLLATEEQKLVNLLGSKRTAAVSAVEDALQVVQQRVATLNQKQHIVLKLFDLPVETSSQAASEFLAGLPSAIQELQTAPAYDDISSTHVTIPDIPVNVEFESARRGIQSISLQEPPLLGHDPAAPTPDGSKPDTSPSSSAELTRLRDLQMGYIWVIPAAAKHFALSQTQDIFSDVFTLLGVAWELRLAAQPPGHLSVFLHASNHINRIDFRVTLVSPNGWYTRNAKNWLESFRGRGWGIKPFIEKRLLLESYVHEDMVKLVVTPTTGLY